MTINQLFDRNHQSISVGELIQEGRGEEGGEVERHSDREGEREGERRGGGEEE